MSKYFQRVPLTIDHDWETTILASKKLMSLESHATSFGTYPPGAGELGSEHLDLKSFGTISKNYKSPNWYRLAGPLVSRSMEPWLSVMLKEMQSLGPDEGAISFLTTDASDHIDQHLL